MRRFRLALAVALAAAAFAAPALAWDSAKFKWLTPIIHSTHSYLTEYALDQLQAQYPDLKKYRAVMVEGANQEMHELPVTGTLYGIGVVKVFFQKDANFVAHLYVFRFIKFAALENAFALEA